MAFIDNLIQQGWLKTSRIIKAFREINRADFLAEDMKDLAEVNEALPIGLGQTISQPLVVAFMLELLQPESGEKILDVGFGSGWTSALLAEIVGLNGKIVAIEIIPELAEFGEKNIVKYNFIEKGIVKCICADGSKGYQKEAPVNEASASFLHFASLRSACVFDKILVSAATKSIPKAWKNQLKIGGKIVAPIDSSIWLFVKKSEDKFKEYEYPGFAFVPLV